MAQHARGRAAVTATADPSAGAATWPAPAAAATGTGAHVDEFRIVRMLGRGGMGSVYLAHDTILDRAVALKLVHCSSSRYLTEARAIARLEHPNVVRIYRAATTPTGRPYLVQELIRGKTLDELDGLTPRRACELALGVARGLAAAHARGILHRDVKRSNIILADDGVVKLLDFGIAQVDAAPANEGLVGTPRYMAPELWRHEAATARSDVYALGVVLYELVAGEHPYAEETAGGLARAIVDGPPPFPLAACSDADPIDRELITQLSCLAARCMEREPECRPSIDEVVHRLDAILGERPLPEGNPYPGLATFDAEHRGVFHGRATDVTAIVERLRDDALVAIAGDSGVGKSSLGRAGVLPAIERGALGDGRRWSTRVVALGRRPLEALRRALGLETAPAQPPASWRALLGLADDEGLVVFVDQLEELVTLAAPDEAAHAAALLASLAAGEPHLRLVTAVRGDLVTRVGALAALGPILVRALYVLRPLGEAQLREAVTGPARACGVQFADAAVVDELIAPVVADPAALPLLQFALAALWDRRDGDAITAASVRALGGVSGGFAGHADAVLGALSPEERLAARRLVLAVVEGHARVSRDRDELCGGDAAASRALEALVRGRILVAQDRAGDAPTYTLVHETLIDAWPRLRGWLDDHAGERGLRARVRAAAAEWRRADRPAAMLWSRGALAGTAAIDDWPATEHAFLEASRRAVRRSRIARAIVLAAVPVAVLGAWLAFDAHAAATRDHEIERHVEIARMHRTEGEAAAERAAALHGQALDAFARGVVDAEPLWSGIATHTRSARTALDDATAALDTALLLEPTSAPVRGELARVLHDLALLAEANNDDRELGGLLVRLARVDDGRWIAPWRAPASVALDVAGVLAHAVRPVVARDHRLVLGAPIVRGAGGRLAANLPAGSYVVELLGERGLETVAPIRLVRGERLALRFRVPDQVRAGYAFVPPGRYLAGSRHDDFFRRDFLGAPPQHVGETGAYLIAHHEVTFGDWIAYLRALPPEERERRRPATHPGRSMSMQLIEDPSGRFELVLQPSSRAYRALEGRPIVYPDREYRRAIAWERAPVSGVSFDDAEAYARWLAETGRVRGARLCREPEWERAARGADGRAYPHGERIEGDDANIDATYGREALAYGPDEVGAHPGSTSPFGVADAAGNVWEWVRGPANEPVLRGGGWYHGASGALSANRDVNERTARHVWAGVRICAEAP